MCSPGKENIMHYLHWSKLEGEWSGGRGVMTLKISVKIILLSKMSSKPNFLFDEIIT